MIGQTLNHYRIRQSLGRGGMGEVFVAEDTRLNRRVALKVLPREFAHDEERRQRFEREARAVAALSHPNIITIYSVEEDQGVHFLTMELVQGKPLSQVIPRNGMRLSQLLDIGVALADGVAAAHERGITHRDLKPDNLVLSDDGRLKILDFGLAKVTDTAFGPVRHSEHPTQQMTDLGRVLGTVAYMSPEQAQGEVVDHRSDIFSLGTVLYEMATGERPFRGDNPASTIAAIIRDEPPLPAELRRDLPWALSRLIKRCLAKDPLRRCQSARDVRNELEELKLELASGRHAEPSGRPQPGAAGWRYVAAGVAGAAIAGTLGFLLRSGAEDDTPLALDGGYSRVTSHSAEEYYPSLSPDGEFVLYAGKASGNWDVYLQRVGGEKSINLTADSTSDDTEPAFSPDGKQIAFRSERGGGGLFLMGATGENVRRLAPFGHNPAWSPDAKEIVCNVDRVVDPMARTLAPEQLWAVNASTGEKRLLTPEDAVQASWSPHGFRIAYWGVHQGGQRDIWTIPASGGQPVQVTRHEAVDWNPVWSPDGRYLNFVSDRGGSMNIWRVAIDERTGEVQGTPEPMTTPSVYSQHVSFSRDGCLLAYVQVFSRVNLQQVEFDAERGRVSGTPRWVTQGPRLTKNADLSPDGEWYVFDSIDNRQEDLFVTRQDGTALSQITQDAYKDRGPRWSPDGRRIAFLSDRSGRYEAWAVNPDGSGLEQLTHTTEGRWAQAPLWSPDGAWLACNLQASAPIIVEAGKPWGQQSPRVASPGRDIDHRYFAWSWSPDGKKLAGYEEGIVTFSLETERFDRLTDFGARPHWLKDSRRMLFYGEDRIYLMDSATKAVSEVLSVAPHRLQTIGISKDNRRLYFSLSTTEADIWLASLQ